MFKIAQHFKTALEECRDVKSNLPNLHKGQCKEVEKKITEKDYDLRRQASFCRLC
jgi:hypothetical protein